MAFQSPLEKKGIVPNSTLIPNPPLMKNDYNN